MAEIKLRIDFDDDRYIGHGRIQLLEMIGKHGSIAKAAKAMGMSYKRAWYLIDEFNDMFASPLVERRHGGRGGGAARLTPFGERLVREYRTMESSAIEVFAPQLRMIKKRLRKDGDTRSEPAARKRRASTTRPPKS